MASIVPVYGIQFFFTQILDMPSKHPLLEMAEANPSAGVLLVISVLAAAAAPLAEEFLFRVLLQGWLEKIQSLALARKTPEADPPPPGLRPRWPWRCYSA